MLILFSKGTLGGGDNHDEPIAEDWNKILESFKQAISSFHEIGRTLKELKDSVITNKQKYKFIKLFRELDNSWYHLKAYH